MSQRAINLASLGSMGLAAAAGASSGIVSLQQQGASSDLGVQNCQEVSANSKAVIKMTSTTRHRNGKVVEKVQTTSGREISSNGTQNFNINCPKNDGYLMIRIGEKGSNAVTMETLKNQSYEVKETVDVPAFHEDSDPVAESMKELQESSKAVQVPAATADSEFPVEEQSPINISPSVDREDVEVSVPQEKGQEASQLDLEQQELVAPHQTLETHQEGMAFQDGLTYAQDQDGNLYIVTDEGDDIMPEVEEDEPAPPPPAISVDQKIVRAEDLGGNFLVAKGSADPGRVEAHVTHHVLPDPTKASPERIVGFGGLQRAPGTVTSGGQVYRVVRHVDSKVQGIGEQ